MTVVAIGVGIGEDSGGDVGGGSGGIGSGGAVAAGRGSGSAGGVAGVVDGGPAAAAASSVSLPLMEVARSPVQVAVFSVVVAFKPVDEPPTRKLPGIEDKLTANVSAPSSSFDGPVSPQHHFPPPPCGVHQDRSSLQCNVSTL